jgi:hypothetical protein
VTPAQQNLAEARASLGRVTDLRFAEVAKLIDPERPATATCCMCCDEADPDDRLGRCPQDAFEGDVEHLGAVLSETWTPAPGLEGWRRDCLATVERLLPRIKARIARKEAGEPVRCCDDRTCAFCRDEDEKRGRYDGADTIEEARGER